MAGWNTDEFESGLLDNFDFTITSALFTYDQRYNEGKTVVLKLEGKTDNPDQPEAMLMYPVGKGWVSSDAGKTIHHESGREGRNLVKSTLYATLVSRMVDLGLGDMLEERGDPFTAAVWLGLHLHMKIQTITFGKGLKDAERPLPTKFIGIDAKFDRKAGSSAPAAVHHAPVSTLSLREQAVEAIQVAKKNGVTDFGSLQAAALEIPGVTDDSELLQELINEEDDGLVLSA